MGRNLLLPMLLIAWGIQAQNCPTVDDVNQIFCQSEGSGNNYYLPAVQHLQANANAAEIAWYDTAESTEPLSSEELLIDGEQYFAGNIDGTCSSRVMVTVTLSNSPNAGATTFYEVAKTDAPFDLLDVYKPSILGPPEAGGTVTPTLASGTTLFNPGVDVSGQYRYTVTSSNETCPDDFSFIYITVVPDPQDPSGDPGEGENCPIVESVVQEFCASQGTGNDFYRPSVAHLAATANGDEILWFDTSISTEPLSMDEILVDGEDYYAGNASGSCVARVRVDCIVNDSPNAGRTTFLTLCSASGPVDILDYMNPSILGEAQPGGQMVPALNSGTTIFDPAIDSAGTYDYHVASSNEFCADDKAVIFISIQEPVNSGGGAILNINSGDLPFYVFDALSFPEGVNATISPSLLSGTGEFNPSEDPAGVYVVTVQNPEGCDDLVVEVTININDQSDVLQNCPNVEFSTQQFCESQGTGNDFYRPSVAQLTASANGDDILWFDTVSSDEPLSSNLILVDGEDYYAGNASGTCTERAVVLVSLSDSPNAGATTSITVNASDAPFDLLERFNPSILGPPDTGGTFNPPLASGTSIFNPALDSSGSYKYSVNSTTDCPDDIAYCKVTIISNEDSEAVAVDANQVVMFPNPSKGNLNVSLSKGVRPISIRIFDISGNTVKNMKLDSALELQNLDISALRPSLYFAEIVTDQGKFVKRIIKN